MTDRPRSAAPPIAGVVLGVVALALAGLDLRFGWVEPAFGAVAHLAYEVPVLAAIRRPTQVPLARMHLAVLAAIVVGGLVASGRLDRHGRAWWAIFAVAYALRAGAWIAGGNLPLVPGDSCHYLEVASSIYDGEGPVKHYVESFFIDYPEIRAGRGTLDDWATPLYPYALAGAYRLTGVVPGRSIEATVSAAKGASFLFDLLCLPALYGFARRRVGRDAALGAVAILAVLPVHVIYGGFVLRESLVCLTSLLAAWALVEVWARPGRPSIGWTIAAGLLGGLAILARNTAMAFLAGLALWAALAHGRRAIAPLVGWGVVVLAVISPWAIATTRAYGEPFYTYTKYFPYNYSWTIHHYARGNTTPGQFYRWSEAGSIVRIKVKALFIIAGYSSMILGAPVVLGLIGRCRRSIDGLGACVALAFVGGTLVNVADVTQVEQLGRYYLPLFAVLLPTAAAGLADWLAAPGRSGLTPALAVVVAAAAWADPTWAYDASWFEKPYQLHWPALRAAGDYVREHPAEVPPGARVMTWFPWEFRLAGRRTTVLMPRNFDGRRIRAVMAQYGVTHVLWGSFEPPPDSDPEVVGPALDRLRLSVGLLDSDELYRSPRTATYPVRLYRVRP